MNKIISMVLACAMMIGVNTGALSKKAEKNTLEEIEQRGKIVVATDATWAPFEYVGADGEVTGSDMEIAKYIADELGVELEILNIAFDSIGAYLQSGEADLGLAAITATEERKETLAFSEPYVVAEQYIVVRSDDESVTYFEDLDGKNIGCHLGTTGDFLVADEIMAGTIGSATEQQYKSLPDASLALINGDLDAIVCDTLMAENLCTARGGAIKCIPVVYKDGSITTDPLCVAMAQGDEAFVAKINEIITPIIEDGTIGQWIVEHTELSTNLD